MHGEPLVDLSADSKAHVDDAENLSHGLHKVERVTQRTFKEYGVKLPTAEKIRATFKSKLWRMRMCVWERGFQNLVWLTGKLEQLAAEGLLQDVTA